MGAEMRDYVLVPLEWIRFTLKTIGGLGLALGFYSAFLPGQSIRFYVKIMEWYNWRVAPIRPEQEMRNTRILGVFMVLVCAFIFLALNRN